MKKKKKKGERMGSYKWSFISVSAITTHFSSSAADKLLSSIVFVFYLPLCIFFFDLFCHAVLARKYIPDLDARDDWRISPLYGNKSWAVTMLSNESWVSPPLRSCLPVVGHPNGKNPPKILSLFIILVLFPFFVNTWNFSEENLLKWDLP